LIPPQDVAQVSTNWPAGNIDARMANYMCQAQQKWAITAVANAGGYPGSPYFKITIAGTELTWHAVDTKNYSVNLYHFACALSKPTSNVLFWAVTIVNCPQEMRGVRLAIGSNAASVWWVNGKEVIGIYGDRQTVIDDGVSIRLTLDKGPNIVRGAVVNGGGATDLCARFLNAEDKPLKGFTVSGLAPRSEPAPVNRPQRQKDRFAGSGNSTG
jgi:hypothetical protein